MTMAIAATAAEPPREFLDAPDALKERLAEKIGHPVYVLEAGFGPWYAEMLVQDKSDPEIFDKIEAQPGQPLAKAKPVKVGDVSCPKAKLPLEQLSFAAAAAALADANAIAAGAGFKPLESIQFRPDVFCKNPAWRVMLSAPDNHDDILEVLYGQDGKITSAQRFDGTRFKKVDPKALARGDVLAKAAPPAPAPAPSAAADGGTRNFRTDPLAAVALLEKTLGAPLKLIDLDVDADRATFTVLDPQNKKRVLTWFVHADGKVEQWRADDTWSVVCAKPFATTEVPIGALPELEQRALASIPPMPHAKAEDVRVRRSGLCGAPHVYVTLEDERATGEVEFDAKGKLVEAKVR
jgi:hypothetical protein